MLPAWVCLVSVLCLGRTSVAQHRSFAFASSSSSPGYAPVTYTSTGGSGTAHATAATPYQTAPVAYRPAYLGRKKRDVASSFSSSVPGYPPVTHTAATGNAMAYAAVNNPVYYQPQVYIQPYIRALRSVSRTDANQQIIQNVPPAGLGSNFNAFPAPPPQSRPIQYIPSPPVNSAPAGIVQSIAPHRKRMIGNFRERYYDQLRHSDYGLPVVDFGSFAGAEAASAAAPAPSEAYPSVSYELAPPPVPQATYGVPDSSEGGDTSVLTVREPHTTYGLPPDDSSVYVRRQSDGSSKSYVFAAHPSGRGSYFRALLPTHFPLAHGNFHPFRATLLPSPQTTLLH